MKEEKEDEEVEERGSEKNTIQQIYSYKKLNIILVITTLLQYLVISQIHSIFIQLTDPSSKDHMQLHLNIRCPRHFCFHNDEIKLKVFFPTRKLISIIRTLI